MTEKLFNPLEHPVSLSFPLWLTETAWAEHIPFAMFLVSAIRPRILVELGSWRGVSYCAFCQAVKETNTKTRCYAVDTWEGDEHAGNLGEDALFNLREHHDPLYASFSNLVQSTFDEALEYFSGGTIDLLHIDGFHTYQAVQHDFETWLPKMSERGIVLLHDTNVHEGTFGVHKFWEEISEKYPKFSFRHGHGLGVLAVGEEIPEDLRFLFETGDKDLIRDYFCALGSRVGAVKQSRIHDKIVHELRKHIKALQTYEKTVNNSRLMRAYRILKYEGLGMFMKKGSKNMKKGTNRLNAEE